MLGVKIVNILNPGIKVQLRQPLWLPPKLLVHLLKVILVNMRIPERVDKSAGFQATNLCDHMRKKGVGSHVERNPDKQISAALV